MRTTENLGRWGCDSADAQEPETELLARARGLFADLSRRLEGEIDRLSAMHDTETDNERIDELQSLIGKSQKAMQTVLTIEAKLMRSGKWPGAGAIDLAEARNEIERRLDRLAGRV